jgi:hypothetical protein
MWDSTLGWFVGGMDSVPYTPIIKKTTDGGEDWIDITPDLGYTLRAVKFVSDTEGWACGMFGTILHTANGGSTWEDQSYPTNSTLLDMEFVNDQKGCAVGDSGVVLFTFNGGPTWEMRSPPAVQENLGTVSTEPFDVRFALNPARGAIRFSLTGDENPRSIRVLDESGRCLSDLEPRLGTFALETRGWASGTYFLHVRSRLREQVVPFVLFE